MRRPQRRAVCLFVLCALGASLQAEAWAAGVDPGQATPVQREQAQSRFLKGRRLYDTGKYAEAIAEFRASHEIVASPNARLYLARSLREHGDLVTAYVELDRTRVEAKELARDDTRYEKAGQVAAVERDALAARIAFLSVHVDNATEETTLHIGGDPIRRAGWGEPTPVMPGAVAVVVATPGRAPVEETVPLKAGAKAERRLDAASAAVVAEDATAADAASRAGDARDDTKPSDRRHLRPYAYVAGGVGAAGLLTFVVAGLMSNGTYGSLESACGAGRACPESSRDDIARGKTQQTIANVGLAIGAIGAAAGVTLFVLSRGEGGKAEPKAQGATPPPAGLRAEFVVGPASAGLRGTF